MLTKLEQRGQTNLDEDSILMYRPATEQISEGYGDNTPQSSSNWHNDFKIPDKFSLQTNQALLSGDRSKITPKMRDEIINSLSGVILQFTITPTPEQYTVVCIKLIQKFPIFKL
jgi:hypothetical protein